MIGLFFIGTGGFSYRNGYINTGEKIVTELVVAFTYD